MVERLLHAVANFARHRYRLIFTVVAVLVLVCAGLATRLEVDTEVLNLLPQDDPVVQTFRETLDEFGSLDFLLIVVRVPEGVVVDPYFEFVDRLGERLEQHPDIDYVDFSIGELNELVEDFFPQALLVLDEESRQRVYDSLSDAGIEQRVQEIRRQLVGPQAITLQELYRMDPLGISDVFLDRVMGGRGALRVDWTSGYFLSADRSLVLLVAKPTTPAQEIEFARRLLGDVNDVVAEVSAEWQTEQAEIYALEAPDETPPPAPEVDFGGTYATAVSDAGTLARDIITNAVTSMLGVLVLFLFAFRRLGVVGYAFVPLATGLVVAVGFAAATVGVLNAITSSFAALLVGLGIDFVIVSYGRYVEERRAGRSLEDALMSMTGSSGRAVVTGGVTSAATFFAFSVTEFTGLRQMGLLVGIGILFCMVSVLVLLPALLAWSEDHSDRKARPMKRYLHGFGADHIVRWCFRHPWPTLLAGALITVVAGLAATQLEFVDSIKQMRPEGNRGVMVETEVGEKFGSGFDYMMFVIDAETESEALETTAEVVAAAESLVGDQLNSVDSIVSILPPIAQQTDAMRWLEERWAVFDPERVRAVFRRAAEKEGLRVPSFEHGLELYTQAVTARPIGPSDLGKSQMESPDDTSGSAEDAVAARGSAGRLLERYVREVGDRWKSVVYLYPPPRTWKREAPPGVLELAERYEGRATLTGVNLVSETLRVLVRSDAVVAAIVGFLLVALLLWIDYGRLRDALLSLAPLMVGIVWMLGSMILFGVHLNFFNIFVTTMIIGIGVDYGVHMMHRYQETRAQGIDLLDGLEETGKAIVLAALSTSVGFGSLSLSSYPGLRSIGLVAILGAVTTSLVAITMLPAVLSLRSARK